MQIFLLILFGFLSGIIGGMGMGGGTILIPFLTLFLNIEQKQAQGINLICFLFLAIPALIVHFKNKLIHKKHLLLIIISGLLFCGAGALLANIINSEILKSCFGLFLIVLGLTEFLKLLTSKKS